MEFFVEKILPPLLSGMVATVITLVITTLIQHKRDKVAYKKQIFQAIIASRSDLLLLSPSTGEFQRAINQVFVAFNDNEEVLRAFEDFRKTTAAKTGSKQNNDQIIDCLLTLLKSMAKDLHIRYDFSNDDLFKQPIFIAPPVFSYKSN